jgi:hypothetical protein
MVRQVYYSSWHDKLKKTHQNYWEDISNIAELIALSLEGGIHGASNKRYRYSSIVVMQYKEKFGTIRVYCRLGDPTLIKEEYKEECKRIKLTNEKYQEWLRTQGDDPQDKAKYPTWTISEYKSGKYPLKKPSLKVFTNSSLIRDARWYRNVYMKFISLFPKYEKAIKSAADYPYLLLNSEREINDYFDSLAASIKKQQTTPQLMKASLSRVERDRQFALSVCFPSIKK